MREGFFILVPLLTLLALAFVVVPILRGRGKPSSTPVLGSLWLALGLASLITIPSIALYYFVGRPDLAAAAPDGGAAIAPDKAQAPSASASMNAMIETLKAKAQQTPGDPEGWKNLGWAYMHIDRPADAAGAYQHAASLAPKDGDALSSLTEAKVQSGDGRITQAEATDFGRALWLTPADPRARFYLALYKDQQGDHKGAIADWVKMLKSAAPDSPWADEVRAVVLKVAQEQGMDVSASLPPAMPAPAAASEPGPDAAQIASAQQMTPADRDTMIHGMVDGLASRLKQNPQDEDGWLRLMRARMVLGQKAQARQDYREARRAFSKAPTVLAVLDDAARQNGVTP